MHPENGLIQHGKTALEQLAEWAAGGGRRWLGRVSAWSPDRGPQASTRQKATGPAGPADRPGCSVPALARISTGRASGSPGAGHIQQLQRLGSMERDQFGRVPTCQPQRIA